MGLWWGRLGGSGGCRVATIWSPPAGTASPCGPCPHCTQASSGEVSPEPASRIQPGVPGLGAVQVGLVAPPPAGRGPWVSAGQSPLPSGPTGQPEWSPPKQTGSPYPQPVAFQNLL